MPSGDGAAGATQTSCQTLPSPALAGCAAWPWSWLCPLKPTLSTDPAPGVSPEVPLGSFLDRIQQPPSEEGASGDRGESHSSGEADGDTTQLVVLDPNHVRSARGEGCFGLGPLCSPHLLAAPLGGGGGLSWHRAMWSPVTPGVGLRQGMWAKSAPSHGEPLRDRSCCPSLSAHRKPYSAMVQRPHPRPGGRWGPRHSLMGHGGQAHCVSQAQLPLATSPHLLLECLGRDHRCP